DALPPLPSLTPITMFENVPTAFGVPESRPVLVEKLAHAGMPEIEKVSASPLASLALGWNEYAVPTITLAAGTPEITGGVLAGGGVVPVVTVMRNAASEVVAVPSVTEMTMSPDVPTFAAAGVPLTRPVAAL